jgi:hypothetical protein
MLRGTRTPIIRAPSRAAGRQAPKSRRESSAWRQALPDMSYFGVEIYEYCAARPRPRTEPAIFGDGSAGIRKAGMRYSPKLLATQPRSL